MAPLRAADILDEVAELLAQGHEDLVLVLDRLCSRGRLATSAPTGRVARPRWGGGRGGRLTIKEGDELVPGALGAQGEGDGRQPVDRIEAEEDVVVLLARLTREAAERGGAGGETSACHRPYLQFVDEHGDGVELIVDVGRVSHGGRQCEGSAVVAESRGAALLHKDRIADVNFWADAGLGRRLAFARGREGCDAMGKWVWPTGRPGRIHTTHRQLSPRPAVLRRSRRVLLR